MTDAAHRRVPRRRRLGGDLPEVGGEVADAKWLAALRHDEDAGPEDWERGVVSPPLTRLANDLTALAERVAALEDCLVWEVAAGQTARREAAELAARLAVLEGSGAAPDHIGSEPISDPLERSRPETTLDEARRARREVVEGLRASVRAASRLLEGRRAGPR